MRSLVNKIIMTFSAASLPQRLALPDCAPDLARRLGVIMLAVATLVARRFLKEPRLVGLIVPLWRWLTHAARRFERALAQVERVRVARPCGETGARKPGFRQPTRHGWLVRELGWEAAGYGSHLAHLLAEPEMQALITAVPGVGRVLRPLCRMLGMKLADVTMLVPPRVAVLAAPVGMADDGGALAGIDGGSSGFATRG